MYRDFLDIIEQKSKELDDLSDQIWDHPETAFSETESVNILINFLCKEGFEVTSPAYGVDTAFTAKYGNGKPVIGILGEYDALAELSQKSDCLWKEKVEGISNGHGCGHNLLGVGGIAAALAVKKYLESGAPGTIIYYGCPGEEGGSGKAFMAREGAFANLDLALSWHPAEVNEVIQDTSLANIQVLYKFSGVSAHAAGNPQNGRSALDAVELMNVGCNFLREHIIDQARIHYAIVNSGGFSPNVVQSYGEVLYLIRAPKVKQVQELLERVNKIAQGMALATETNVEYEIIKSCSNLIPNHVLEASLLRSFQKVPMPVYTKEERELARKYTLTASRSERAVLETHISRMNQQENSQFLQQRKLDDFYDFVIPYEKKLTPPLMGGSTDVGDVSWQCPTAQIETSTWAPNSGGHSWQIVSQGKGSMAHKAMRYAGKVLAETIIYLLTSPDVVKQAKEEYKERMQGEVYMPIPKEIKPRPMEELGRSK
ncbi:MAG: amidohydrolase [Lachnospiraceae bacterium]|jgi:aminobenzoyl-glutamate utilization protein B|nr:amidohydrolase [Lachnospiraceae bacterium]